MSSIQQNNVPDPKAPMTIDGIEPGRTARPGSAREVAELLSDLDQSDETAIIIGAGTKIELGMPPLRADVALETTRVSGIVELEAANMVCTVRAGTPLADVQRELAPHGQRVPLDPPHIGSTIGGIVATASTGPRRSSLGAVRDLVLGIQFALPDGSVCRAGGRVVKNVQGYDLMKLHTGALGTLGVITEVSLRLKPLARDEEGFAAGFRDVGGAASLCHELFKGALPVSYALAVGPGAASTEIPLSLGGEFWVLAALEGRAPTRARIQRHLEELAKAHGACDLHAVSAGDVRGIDEGVAALGARRGDRYARARLSSPPGAWGSLVRAVERLAEPAGVAALWTFGAGSEGALHLTAEDELGLARVATKVRRLLVGHDTLTTWEVLPTSLKRDVGVWPNPGPALGLMRELKRQLDPKSVLNPGRFAGGI